MDSILIMTTITFFLAIIASIPALYFTFVFFKRNKLNALLSFLLFIALVIHAIFHLTKAISPNSSILPLFEFISALMILIYSIDHLVMGRINK